MFYTGVRNAEAIGLRVKHIDLINRQVEIGIGLQKSNLI
jgi:integrase